MKSLIFLAVLLMQWRGGVSQISYCDPPVLNQITDSGDVDLFLDEPEPACFGCYFFDSEKGFHLKPGTFYATNKGTPLLGKQGVTIFDNGTVFIKDASAVFKDGDTLQCTFNGVTYTSIIQRITPTLSPPAAGDNPMLNNYSPGDKKLIRGLRDTRDKCPTFRGLSLREGEVGFIPGEGSRCQMVECIKRYGYLTFRFSTAYCSDYETVQCDEKDLDPYTVEALKCCSKCSISPVASLDIPDENLTTTSMTVEWEFNELSEDITKVVITYIATHNNATPSEGVIDVDYPVTSVTIFGLQPLTTYKVSAVVHSKLSDTFGSSIVVNQEVDTLPLAPFSPLIISVTAHSTTLCVTWTAISNPIFQTETDVYQIKYLEGTSWDDETADMVYVRHPGVHVSTNLSDLKPNTCYTITICSSNTGGMSPNSNMVTACTDDDYDYDEYDDEYDDESDVPSRSGSHTH